jgi:simple sugar transport system permease protein
MLLGKENKVYFSFKGLISWTIDNLVTIIFLLLVLFGFMASQDISVNYFLQELNDRIFRNTFLVLSLIIPVLAGLGLNFGIVIGAMSGQAAIIVVRYFGLGGTSGLLLCFVISFFIAAFCGYLTGKLYNKTRGQEMIASLIVGYFANGVYQFVFLFVVGVIIPVTITHPMIIPSGIGIRMTVDLMQVKDGGLKYAIDNIYKIPYVYALLIISLAILAILIFVYCMNKRKGQGYKNRPVSMCINSLMCLAIAGVSAYAINIKSGFVKIPSIPMLDTWAPSLLMVPRIPVITGLLIIVLCILTELIMKTKIGQDFRSVGQSQHIAEVSGINVDRTRIIATVISTVLAAWGMILYIQNMGTLNTYGAHMVIGMFSVASLLVGGASTSRASVKNAVFGVIIFNAMFIVSPAIGKALFGNPGSAEYFRTFMVYGVIGVALGLHVWKGIKKSKIVVE